MNPIYLDNNATTRVADEVVEAMLPYFTGLYGNASSMHTFGNSVKHKVAQAREQVADLLGCQPDEVIFTSCGTESDNASILSTMEAYPNKKHIITTRVEHPAVRTTCRHLRERGFHLTELPVDGEGMLSLQQLKDAITDDTALVSVMHANNETGVIFPIDEIAWICKTRGTVLHTDAVQSVGKIPIDLSKTPIDLLALSGHKLHAPKGIGVLFVRRGTKLPPFLKGGHQEAGRRAGTENVPYIIGLGVACELAQKNMTEENTRVRALRDRLQKSLLETCQGARVNGNLEHRLPNTLNISFEFVEGEAILLQMNAFGICASSGSACTSGSLEPSHVMRAMGVPFTRAHGSTRFSLSRYTTDAEIDTVLRHLPGIIDKLRAMSPFGREEMATSKK
jgi:cysteine desulfurase